jgi:dethiobiotin synthetase
VTAPAPALRLAVTGTDTGVGKTLVTCALLAALRAGGRAPRALKPVETGITERHAGTDAARLHRASGGAGPRGGRLPRHLRRAAGAARGRRARRAPVDWTRVEAARARQLPRGTLLVVGGRRRAAGPVRARVDGGVVDLAISPALGRSTWWSWRPTGSAC